MQTLFTCVAVALALLLAALHLAWASGTHAGLSSAVLADMPDAHELTNAVDAAFAVGAAAGLVMLVHRTPRDGRLLAPLALAWGGAGSMFAWGGYEWALSVADPELGSSVLQMTASLKLLTGGSIVVIAAFLVAERFARAPAGQSGVD